MIATATLPPSPQLARPFCALAFLFFAGAFTHLFDAATDWFVPLAALLQAIALALLIAPQRRPRALALLRRNLPLLFAIALATLSALWSPDPLLTLRRAIALGGTTAIGLLVYLELPRAELLRFFAQALALFTLASVALALLAPDFGTQPDQHWRGLHGHKNQAAWHAVLALLCWLGARKTPSMRPHTAPVLALTLLLLWQTDSATGLLALLFGLAVLLFAHAFARHPLLRPAFLALALMALVTLLFHPQDLLQTALSLLDRDTTLTGRTALWSALWPLIEAKFWLGNGYMAFWDHAPDYFGAASWMARLVHAHNTYVQLLLDLGAVGLASLLLLLLTTAWGLLQQARGGDADALTLLALLLTLAFIGLAGDIFLRPNTGHWIMLVAIALYARDPPPKATA